MTRYAMPDGIVVDTAKATDVYHERTTYDGRNSISLATGEQWEHETLYRSRRGRYYVERSSDWQGRPSSAAWLTAQQAAAWLLRNHYPISDLPADLAALADEVYE
jgi:hypothetical protein